MKTKIELEELIKTAEKILAVAENMDNAFEKENSKEHLKLVIAGGLIDMYNRGYRDGYSTGANGYEK